MERLDTKKKALDWLYQDELMNLMSIEGLEHGGLEILYAGTQSLLLSDGTAMMIHCKDQSEWTDLLPKVCQELPKDRFFILRAHEDWYLEELMEQTGLKETEPYLNSMYPTDFPLMDQLPEHVTIRPLTMAEFPLVRATYRTVDEDDYIRERIEAGMLGAWYGEEMAGFIGTHDEGTIGLLEVLPAFRRKGIARALEVAMVRSRWKQGRRAQGNIAVDNQLSRTVHEKMGILISQNPVYWFFPAAPEDPTQVCQDSSEASPT
ncbi:GNAT family N-acetyltransferase [Clostridiaceae bacterium HFYG-1003]|nr:GNAT family N-acetyltransferase [Clostridiaceae bacterium HFYG-1003]